MYGARFVSGDYRFERLGQHVRADLLAILGDSASVDAFLDDLEATPEVLESTALEMLHANRVRTVYDFIVYDGTGPIAMVSAADILHVDALAQLVVAPAVRRQILVWNALNIGVVVCARHQRRGHGARILRAFVTWLNASWRHFSVGVHQMVHGDPVRFLAFTRETNLAATALFRRCGFVEVPGATRPGVVLLVGDPGLFQP